MQLYFVRHAAVLVDEPICYGWLDIAACPEDTRKAVQQLPKKLVGAGWQVYCSPLRRCRALVQTWREHGLDGAAVTFSPHLREMHFGAWEGQLWDAIGKQAMDAWVADFAFGKPAQGAESVVAMLARVAWMYQFTEQQGGKAVWVSHAGVYRALCWLLEEAVRLPLYASLHDYLSKQHFKEGGSTHLGELSAEKNRANVRDYIMQHAGSAQGVLPALPTAATWPKENMSFGACVQI